MYWCIGLLALPKANNTVQPLDKNRTTNKKVVKIKCIYYCVYKKALMLGKEAWGGVRVRVRRTIGSFTSTLLNQKP